MIRTGHHGFVMARIVKENVVYSFLFILVGVLLLWIFFIVVLGVFFVCG